MNLQQLQYFRTIAECGQVTKAAHMLHVSQPALSMSIAALEEELEVTLFEKKGRLLQLTACGRIFLGHITTALNEIENGRQEISQLALTNNKIIRIASTYSLSISLIPTLVKEFTQLHPNTIFHLKQGPNLELLENLSQGETDFILGRIIPGEEKYENIGHIPLYSESLVVLLHKDHPLAKRERIPIDQLQDEDFIFFHESTGYNIIITELFRSVHIEPRIRYEVYDNSTCAALVSANQGIALVVPSDSYDSSTLRQVKIQTPSQFDQTKVCLLYSKGYARNPSPLHRTFLEYIQTLDFASKTK